jgi:hypothetical protein
MFPSRNSRITAGNQRPPPLARSRSGVAWQPVVKLHLAMCSFTTGCEVLGRDKAPSDYNAFMSK